MYFGYPYTVDLQGVAGKITLKIPTMGNLVLFGEKRFFSNLNLFITNTSTYKVMLWDLGIDWNDMSDYDLFLMLFKTGIDQEACDMLFETEVNGESRQLNWSKFELLGKNIKNEDGTTNQIPVLYNAEDDIEINEDVYQHIHQYLQEVFDIHPEEKYTKDPMLKKWWVDAEKRKNARDEKKPMKETSIQSVISACINHPGFKYNLEQLKEVGVCQFYDSVRRLQVYQQTTACLSGMYGGMIDGSKIDPNDYNFMKEI